MPSLEPDERVKEGKGLKTLTPNNLLTRLLKQREVYGFTLKMKQLILIITLQTLLVLNLSIIRLNY